MFVRRRRSIPDPVFPKDLTSLGLTITPADQLRQLADPTLRFEYKVHKNPRLNELRRESMNSCLREIVWGRLIEECGLVEVRLTGEERKAGGGQVPEVGVLVTRDLVPGGEKRGEGEKGKEKEEEDVKKEVRQNGYMNGEKTVNGVSEEAREESESKPFTGKNILLLIPTEDTDLGLWSYRALDGPLPQDTVSTGSMVSFVRRALALDFSIVIFNTGALIYDPDYPVPDIRGGGKGLTVTSQTWQAGLRPWKTGGKARPFDVTWNLVKGSESPEAHVELVMERVLKRVLDIEEVGGKAKGERVRLYVVAAGGGAGAFVGYLDKNFDTFGPHLHALALCEPSFSFTSLQTDHLRTFIQESARAYIIDAAPLGEQVNDDRFGCATFSADTIYSDCVVSIVEEFVWAYFQTAMLVGVGERWMNPEPPRIVVEKVLGEGEGEGEGEAGEENGEGGSGGGGRRPEEVWGDGSSPGCGW